MADKIGTNGNDVIWGSFLADFIAGLNGDDRLSGGLGDDEIDGGNGFDTAVYLTGGNVTVDLGNGLGSGAMGYDHLTSIEGAETGSGNDTVFGSEGANTIQTGGGNDVVYALGGNDVVHGEDGNDIMFGYAGNDSLIGGAGHDRIWGNEDNDIISAHTGNDIIEGGQGADIVMTGTGADVLRWEDGDLGLDAVLDFDLAHDRLFFELGFFAQDVGNGVALEDVLNAYATADGTGTMLLADTAESGWEWIARLDNVDHDTVNAMISSGDILAPVLTGLGDGAPGGFVG